MEYASEELSYQALFTLLDNLHLSLRSNYMHLHFAPNSQSSTREVINPTHHSLLNYFYFC